MEFKIEDVDVSGIVNPPKSKVYPFHLLEVGQSFLFPKESWPAIRAAATYYSKKTGRKLSIKRDGKNYRCGRVG